jgi:hypothetical protein
LATILVGELLNSEKKYMSPNPPSVSNKNKLKISVMSICLNIPFNVFFSAL